jgi:hypothetical protein
MDIRSINQVLMAATVSEDRLAQKQPAIAGQHLAVADHFG